MDTLSIGKLNTVIGSFQTLEAKGYKLGNGFSRITASFVKTEKATDKFCIALNSATQLLKKNKGSNQLGSAYNVSLKKSKRNTQQPASSGGQLGSIYSQSKKVFSTLESVYKTGSKSLENAQQATGLLKSAWTKASAELKKGKGFFSVLQSVSPLIGEGLIKTQETISGLGQTIDLAKGGVKQAQTLGSSIKESFPLIKSGIGKIGHMSGALWGLAKGAMRAVVVGIRAIGVTLMANPIGLIVGGIALAAGLIYTYWEPIKGFFTGLWSGVSASFSQTWEWIKSSFLNFSPLGLIIQHWEPITGFFTGMWEGIKSVFGAAWEWIESSFLAPIENIKNSIGKVWNLFSSGEDESNPVRHPSTNQNKKGIGAAIALSTAAVAAPLAADTPAANVAQPATVNQQSHYEINIHASPGMNEQQLAMLVKQELERYEQQKQMNKRRALYD